MSTIFDTIASKEIILTKDESLLLKDLPNPSEQLAFFVKACL
jgi:hypothetical protein